MFLKPITNNLKYETEIANFENNQPLHGYHWVRGWS